MEVHSIPLWYVLHYAAKMALETTAPRNSLFGREIYYISSKYVHWENIVQSEDVSSTFPAFLFPKLP